MEIHRWVPKGRYVSLKRHFRDDRVDLHASFIDLEGVKQIWNGEDFVSEGACELVGIW